jgi:hypothetical protein
VSAVFVGDCADTKADFALSNCLLVKHKYMGQIVQVPQNELRAIDDHPCRSKFIVCKAWKAGYLENKYP